ncbi:MAG TPA: iron-sulfur cluster assembly accessory protein [Polyangiaceae bacterium]|nr:iron-sulfur cluster assembly accessory protein [Polyangiaceae bacterium]
MAGAGTQGTAMESAAAQPQREAERGAAATPSFAVSPGAVDAIARQLKKRGTPGAGLRVGIRGGGCSGFSYVIEFHDGPPHARDRVFEFTASDATPVRVVVDPKSLLYLNGTVLEWEQTLMRQGFKFANPNEKSGCGCGSSFSV